MRYCSTRGNEIGRDLSPRAPNPRQDNTGDTAIPPALIINSALCAPMETAPMLGHSSVRVAAAPDLSAIMHPLGTECLGWFCLAYHTTDSPGRPEAIRRMLLESELLDDVAIEDVSRVLSALLLHHPACITAGRRGQAAVQPVHPSPCATLVCPLWVPSYGDPECSCGARRQRWKTTRAKFITLSAGVRDGFIVHMSCARCATSCAGCWQWGRARNPNTFPDGEHQRMIACLPPAGGPTNP